MASDGLIVATQGVDFDASQTVLEMHDAYQEALSASKDNRESVLQYKKGWQGLQLENIELKSKLDTYASKLSTARKALEFYSDASDYEYEQSDAPFETLPKIIYCRDNGQTAREALKEIGGDCCEQ